MENGVCKTRPTPAQPFEKECAQGPADCAGKTAKERQCRDRWPRILAIEPAQGGEGGIIEAASHPAPDHHPGEKMKRKGWGKAESQETEGQEHGPHSHYKASALHLDGT